VFIKCCTLYSLLATNLGTKCAPLKALSGKGLSVGGFKRQLIAINWLLQELQYEFKSELNGDSEKGR
jgi:hypothetical protein